MSRAEATINKIIIIVLSFVPFFGGIGLVLAGTRTKKKKWTICGLIYILASCVLMSIGFVEIYIVLWGISIVHTVVIRKEYCMRLKVLKNSKDILSLREKEKEDKIYKEIIGEDKEMPKQSIKTENVKISSVDINSCEETELGTIPGIGLILAKRIIDIRKEQPFASIDEFYKRVGIGEEKQKLMERYLRCNENTTEDIVRKTEKSKGENNSRNIGRKIDI